MGVIMKKEKKQKSYLITKSFRNVVCFMLVAVLILSAAGCNGGSSNNGKSENSSNNEAAKQNVFSYEEINLDIGEWDNVNYNSLCQIGDRFYIVINATRYGSGSAEMYGYARDVIAEAAGVTAEEEEDNAEEEDNTEEDVNTEEDGITGEDTGGYYEDSYENVMMIVSFLADGSDVKITELNTGEDSNDSWMGTMILTQTGQLYANRETYYYDDSDPDNYVSENRQELICWDAESGDLLWTKSLDELKGNNDYFYINRMVSSPEGKLYLQAGANESSYIYGLDSQGDIKFKQEFRNDAGYVDGLYISQDGSLIITSYNNDYTKKSVVTLNPDTGDMGESQELPGTLNSYSMYSGSTTDFLLTNSVGIFTYNIGDQDVKPVMNYVNSDLAVNSMNNMVMLDDTHFVAAYYDGVNYDSKISYFTKVDPKDIPDKEVLVLGTYYLNGDIRQRIIEYNKTNSKYRITVNDYSSYSTMDDYLAGYTQLNNEILAGNMPDILIVDSNIPVDNYISKGLLADIGKLIDNDAEISREDYLENVFEAFSVDGTLYSVVPSFYVQTMVGKTSLVGDKQGWTMEEMQNLVSTMPDDMSIFGDITKMTFLYYIMHFCGTDFINQSTGKCTFSSQEFINLLEFAATLPDEINYDDEYYMNYYTTYETQYRENRTLLQYQYLYDLRYLNRNLKTYFGESVTFIGFPNSERNGSIINGDGGYAISSKSKNIDGAWEFIRYYLTDEYQKNLWGFPVKRDLFMEKAKEATQRPYYMNENNEKVEYDDTYYVNNEEIVIAPMTQEEMGQVIAFIESVNRTSYFNNDIYAIIEEEAAPFFSGQKSAADVAQIIQSRAQIYVNENR